MNTMTATSDRPHDRPMIRPCQIDAWDRHLFSKGHPLNLTFDQVQGILGCSLRTLQRLINADAFTPYTLTNMRSKRISRREVARFLCERNAQKGARME